MVVCFGGNFLFVCVLGCLFFLCFFFFFFLGGGYVFYLFLVVCVCWFEGVSHSRK